MDIYFVRTRTSIGGQEQGFDDWLGSSLKLSSWFWQGERQLHGSGTDAIPHFHVYGSEIQGPMVPVRILFGNRRGDVMVDIHHQGSSFSDGGQLTVTIPEDGIVETEGLGHDEEISPLTCVEQLFISGR